MMLSLYTVCTHGIPLDYPYLHVLGHEPASKFLEGQVPTDEVGYILVSVKCMLYTIYYVLCIIFRCILCL